MKIREKFKKVNDLINNDKVKLKLEEDIYTFNLLQSLLAEGNYLPYSAMAMRPFSLAYVLNEIVVNKRTQILEFGSGISTILICRLIKRNNLNIKFKSVDHDINWIALVKSNLEKESLEKYVDFIHSPLIKRPLEGNLNHWYELGNLTEIENYKVDLLLVDGPTAFSAEIATSRYFALDFTKDNLLENAVIFLDDASRDGELRVMKKWSKEFLLNFDIVGSTLGVCYIGNYYESCPLITSRIAVTIS